MATEGAVRQAFALSDSGFVDATLAALFVVVVLASVTYGVINILKALGSSRSTAVEIGLAGAAVGGGNV